MPIRNPRIIAHHLILSGYGFWLANDPRGSGSKDLRESKFEALGPIHPGRKRKQPSRSELRQFYLDACPRLESPPLWFDQRARTLIGAAFGDVVKRANYTVWACFVGSNHSHLCIRYHRDSYEKMWEKLAGQSRLWILEEGLADEKHRVWAERPYSVFLHSPEDVRRVMQYIEENAEKEGLERQSWGFVKEYAGWPVKAPE